MFAAGIEILRKTENLVADSPPNSRVYRVPSLHTFLESTVYRPSEKRPKTLKNPWQMQEMPVLIDIVTHPSAAIMFENSAAQEPIHRYTGQIGCS